MNSDTTVSFQFQLGSGVFTRGTHGIQHSKFFRRVGERFLDGLVIVLDLVGNGLPEVVTGLDKSEGQGNRQVGNGGGVRKDEFGILEEAFRQSLEMSLEQFVELFLGNHVVAVHSETNVSDGREAVENEFMSFVGTGTEAGTKHTSVLLSIVTTKQARKQTTKNVPWIQGCLTPVESKIDLSSLEGIRGIQLIPILGYIAKVPHDRGGLPNGHTL